jgi:hypothetical protein
VVAIRVVHQRAEPLAEAPGVLLAALVVLAAPAAVAVAVVLVAAPAAVAVAVVLVAVAEVEHESASLQNVFERILQVF